MKLIVGLGNPGKIYENTRHNSGFIVIDSFALDKKLNFKEKFGGLYAEYISGNEKVILLKPQKYMNLSGEVIKDFINYYNIDNRDILVIYDDVNFELGQYKLRRDGSSAGHNGIKNIILNIKTEKFSRLKIGISKNNINLEKYVLGKFSIEENKKIQEILPILKNILDDFPGNTIDQLMNKYNGDKDEMQPL